MGLFGIILKKNKMGKAPLKISLLVQIGRWGVKHCYNVMTVRKSF